MRQINETSGEIASKNTLTHIILIIWITLGLLASACQKKSAVSDESDKFIQVFAAYLNRIPGASLADSLRTAILDSVCQEHQYSQAKFQKRLLSLNQEPEKWGQTMDRVHKLMIQQKMQQATETPPVSPSQPAIPKP